MSPAVYWTLVDAAQLPLEPYQDFLSQPESHRLSSLRFPKRRNEWLLGRWASKRLVQSLSPYKDYRLNEIEIHNAPDGAPYILHPGGAIPPTKLSISHSDQFALCVFAPCQDFRIGADIEKVEPRSEGFIEDYFTAAEQEMIGLFPSPLRQTAVNLVWSMKESMLKALGVGLHWNTRKVEVRQINGLFPLEKMPGIWLKMELGDFQDDQRQWAGWWQCRGDFVITVAGFTSTAEILQSIQLLEKIV